MEYCTTPAHTEGGRHDFHGRSYEEAGEAQHSHPPRLSRPFSSSQPERVPYLRSRHISHRAIGLARAQGYAGTEDAEDTSRASSDDAVDMSLDAPEVQQQPVRSRTRTGCVGAAQLSSWAAKPKTREGREKPPAGEAPRAPNALADQ
jgi:hypothetical protein